MKITKPVFGQERKELEKFNKLNLDERSIVFYSEDVSSFVHFEQIIHELTEKMGYCICYVTSAKDDPMLNKQNKRIRVFYIGHGAMRTKFFMELKTEVLVMTMPNLETHFIKRSRVYPVHYVYVFHSMVSTHKIYEKGAFDHFDSIFCAGPHHVEEISATESVYNLNHKKIPFAAERSPEKWGKYTIGSGIKIISENEARNLNPDYFFVMPYAFIKEFIKREKKWLKKGGKFILPYPNFKVINK